MSLTVQLEFHEVLNLLYFTDVKNVDEVKEKLTDRAYPFTNCTAVNSQLILEPFQIIAAANKAVISKINDNITASLELFGYASSNDKTLLLIIFDNDTTKIKDVVKEVQGTLTPSSSLNAEHNVDLIKRIYEITEEQLTYSSLLNLIVTKIACKSV